MNMPSLGKSPSPNEGRDAIHIAVIPQIADRVMYPGEHLVHGIVDPYRTLTVRPGDTYWLLLYPQTITSLRHEWVHPAFPNTEPASKETPQKVIQRFAGRCDLSYLEMLEIGRGYLINGDSYYDNDLNALHSSDDWNEFYNAVAELEGLTPVTDHYPPFSCAC